MDLRSQGRELHQERPSHWKFRSRGSRLQVDGVVQDVSGDVGRVPVVETPHRTSKVLWGVRQVPEVR